MLVKSSWSTPGTEIEIPFGQSKDEFSTRNIYCASISIDAFLSIKDLDFQWK